MKTMRNLFLLCAGLSLFACSSDDEVNNQFPEGAGAVTVKIVAPQSRAADATFSADEQIVNGTITLSLTHSAIADMTVTSPTTKTITYSDGSYSGATDNGDGTLTVVFYNIGEPTALTATMNGGVAKDDYNEIEINRTSSPNMQADPENIPVYGSTTDFTPTGDFVTENANNYQEYEATINLEIPVARLEVQITNGTFTDFGSVAIAGAYLDNIKPDADANAENYKLELDNSATATGNNAILYDNYFESAGLLDVDEALWLKGGTENLTIIPATDKCFAYNIYPGSTPIFKLCLVVDEIQDADAIAPIQYAIINKFKEGQTELNEFEAGKIYQVKNLTLNGDNIQVDEAGNELAYGLTAIVEQAKWSVVETTGSWAQGQ